MPGVNHVGPDLEIDAHIGSPGPPREVIDKLNARINARLKSAELRSALAKLSNQPLGGTPQDFTDTIKGDIGKWAPIVKALGLTAG